MKVLIISYDFYPEAKPNTYRWFNIAKKWAEEGIDVYVLTANKNEFLSFEEVQGVKIYRSTEYFAGNLKYKFRGNLGNGLSNSQIKPNKTFKTLIKGLIRKVYDLTWSNFYWPDHSFLWIKSGYSLASKIIMENNIDKVITVSWTFSAHIIGLKLKRKFKNIYWLADTIDPFSFNASVNNDSIYRKLNVSKEKEVFENADFNAVLTEKIKAEYTIMFPRAKNKIEVINNVFIPIQFDFTKPKNSPDDAKLKIVFLGTLSKDTRSPENALQLINNLVVNFKELDFRVDFYGDFTDTMQFFENYPKLLDSSVFLHGFISKENVYEVIKNADILLNIGNNNEFQEPSKLIEYMYSGKKILNVCSIDEDTSSTLLKIYPLSLSIFAKEINDPIVMDKMVNFFRISEPMDETDIKHLLNDYLLETIADKYLKTIFPEY